MDLVAPTNQTNWRSYFLLLEVHDEKMDIYIRVTIGRIIGLYD